MGVAQNAIGGAFDSIGSAVLTSVVGLNQSKELAAKAAEEKTLKSYNNELNKALGEAGLEGEKFQKALKKRDEYSNMMRAQRAATQQYRNQFNKSSEEYKNIEKEGQARKERNFQAFRAELRKIKGGK